MSGEKKTGGQSENTTLMLGCLAILTRTCARARTSAYTHHQAVAYFTHYPNEYLPQTHQSGFLLCFKG